MLEMQTAVQQMQAEHQQQISALQSQIQQQQTVIDSLKKGAEPAASVASAAAPAPLPSAVPAPAASAPPLFPTSDAAVVASSVVTAPASAPSAAATSAFPTTDASVTSYASPAASSAGAALAAPIQIASGGGGKNYMNISFDGQFSGAASSARDLGRIEVGDHDPQQRGFNARNSEIALDGAVDPYFEGFANIVLKLSDFNETTIELEEAFLQTTNLPYNLQIKAGQFFSAFGRINPTHPHTWDFADAPLVHGRLLGSDGLRGVGAQVSWTAPVAWYSQFIFSAQNGRGNTGFSFRNPGDNGTVFGRQTIDRQLEGVQDLVFIPRWENSVDLSSTQTVLFGVSGAFGPNDTGPKTRTEIYGADLLYKWKSPTAEGGFPFVKWQSEAMYRRFEAGRGENKTFPLAETFDDWGAYSQVLYGFKKGWVTGVRGDYLHMKDSPITDDPDRQTRERLSADLTWYPTEFSKLRLQYNHDFLEATHFLNSRSEDSVFFQFEFILGAHGAHKF